MSEFKKWLTIIDAIGLTNSSIKKALDQNNNREIKSEVYDESINEVID